jgi:hypothetical protein
MFGGLATTFERLEEKTEKRPLTEYVLERISENTARGMVAP